jgi:small subunit ribosomal protein S9
MADAKAASVYLGTGRRKTAVARVRVTEGGKGQISINGRPLEQFFTEHKDRNAVVGPLELCGLRTKLNVSVTVSGGGYSGQAGATSQGLARALKTMFGGSPEPPAPGAADGQAGADGQPVEDTSPFGLVKRLRDSGYLTRDGRMKERKKYGRKGARKSFQFSKR